MTLITELTERDYSNSVQSHAAEVLRRVRDKEADLPGAIYQVAKASQWTIYTGRALKLLGWSKHENAAWEVDGVDVFRSAQCMADIYTTAAFFALCEDIQEAVEALLEESEEGDA